MNKNALRILIVSVVAAAGVFLYLGRSGSKTDSSKKSNKSSLRESKKGGRIRKVRDAKKTDRRLSSEKKNQRSRKVKVNRDDSDYKNLTPEQRALMDSIQRALDDDNKDELLRLVQKLQNTPGWPLSVPVAVRAAAIDALGWFGSACLPEAVGFVSDPDADIADAARTQFTNAIEDSDSSDRERSSMMVMAAKVISDTDTMETILFELNNMRHSVAVETVKSLWASGNRTTQALLAEAVESLTGEQGVTTPEKLDQWLEENPDDEGDEEFYGGVK